MKCRTQGDDLLNLFCSSQEVVGRAVEVLLFGLVVRLRGKGRVRNCGLYGLGVYFCSWCNKIIGGWSLVLFSKR